MTTSNNTIGFTASPFYLTQGAKLSLMLAFTGAPNTSYDVEFWFSSPALNADADTLGATRQVATDAAGKAAVTVESYDMGVVPRGIYKQWAKVPALGLTSDKADVVFAAHPPATPLTAPHCVALCGSQGAVASRALFTAFVQLTSAFKRDSFVRFSLDQISPTGAVVNPSVAYFDANYTLDSQDRAQVQYDFIDTGILPRGTYQLTASLGDQQLYQSVIAPTTFTLADTTTTFQQNSPKVYFGFDRSVLVNGDELSHLTTVTDLRPLEEVNLQLWAKNANYNGGQWTLMRNYNISANHLGVASDVMVTTLTSSTPRGSWEYRVVTADAYYQEVSSKVVTATFN